MKNAVSFPSDFLHVKRKRGLNLPFGGGKERPHHHFQVYIQHLGGGSGISRRRELGGNLDENHERTEPHTRQSVAAAELRRVEDGIPKKFRKNFVGPDSRQGTRLKIAPRRQTSHMHPADLERMLPVSARHQWGKPQREYRIGLKNGLCILCMTGIFQILYDMLFWKDLILCRFRWVPGSGRYRWC